MTDNKLTPRVGDRVLYERQPGDTISRSKTGTVVEQETESLFGVEFDDGDKNDRGELWLIDIGHLTVLDRVPVEWPDGWERDYEFAYNHETNIRVNKPALQELLSTGPDMLERWNELMGGGTE